jgi:cytochrome c oxidase subunit I
MGPIADTLFAVTTMLIGIPTGVKIFNWIFTMWGGDIRFTAAMKFAIALVALFTIGGISGVMHASPPADLQQTDTYFIVAHFHYVLFGGSMMGLWAGVYYYFPKLTGRMLGERLGSWHFWLTFIGMNLTFMPMHWSGLLGMPRRTWVYDSGQGLEIWNLMSSIGAYIQVVAVLVGFWNLLKSWRSGARAGADPWGAPTLEWSIPSPPPEYNFATIPTVTSRYPLWDRKSPELTTEVPHTREGERGINVDVAGKRVGHIDHAIGNPPGGPVNAVHTEGPVKSAKELGIPMPNPSIKPLFVALWMTLMFASMLPMHFRNPKPMLAVAGIITFAILLALTLYSWLLTPLEDEH